MSLSNRHISIPSGAPLRYHYQIQITLSPVTCQLCQHQTDTTPLYPLANISSIIICGDVPFHRRAFLTIMSCPTMPAFGRCNGYKNNRMSEVFGTSRQGYRNVTYAKNYHCHPQMEKRNCIRGRYLINVAKHCQLN